MAFVAVGVIWTAVSLGVFALIRVVAVGAATASGYLLFEDHSVWAMLTVVIGLRRPTTVGVERVLVVPEMDCPPPPDAVRISV